MRFRYVGAMLLVSLVALEACSSAPSQVGRNRDANTPAGKLGQAAYKASVEANKASQAIGRKLNTAAHNAREGWQEAARKDRQSKRRTASE